MKPIDQIISQVEDLSKNLEAQAWEEKKYCFDLCLELERLVTQTNRMADHMKGLREFYVS